MQAPFPSCHADVMIVAQWFINRSQAELQHGDLMSHYKLQKLVYYAQAWSLALDDRMLFDDDLMAWLHGPFVDALFERLKKQNFVSINSVVLSDADMDEALDDKAEDTMELVYQSYAFMTAKALESLTMGEEPWQHTRRGLEPFEACDRPMDLEHMRNYYIQKYNDYYAADADSETSHGAAGTEEEGARIAA